jgi:hypothetical protein
VEQHVDAFLGEWQATTVRVAEAVRAKDVSFLKEIAILPGMKGSGNSINGEGMSHIRAAAEKLLVREKLAAKLQCWTAMKALGEGLEAHIPKALKTKILSEHAIVAKAAERLRAYPRDDGFYVFPVVFAPRATTTDFNIGAARIVAKQIFEAELTTAWARHDAEEDKHGIGARLADDWRQHSADFDHFIILSMEGFEEKMAWPAAMDAAEMMLNIFRMYFGFQSMDDVRIGNGFIWQSRRSSLRLTKKGGICLSSSFGGNGSHLESGWEATFECDLSNFAALLATAVTWPTVHDGRPDPMFERLIYFNRLIAEAYGEPHDPIRLVRLISALEAFSLIGSTDKAHNLAHRCGAAGGWGDPHVYCAIYDAVREGYRWRNAVVHGDAPPEVEVRRAFHRIERHLLNIYLGMLSLHAGIANDVRPRSVARLRREFARRIDMFFWAPSLVT